MLKSISKIMSSLALIASASIAMGSALAEDVAAPDRDPQFQTTLTREGAENMGQVGGSGAQNFIGCVYKVDSASDPDQQVQFGYIHTVGSGYQFEPQGGTAQIGHCQKFSFGAGVIMSARLENFHTGDKLLVKVWQGH